MALTDRRRLGWEGNCVNCVRSGMTNSGSVTHHPACLCAVVHWSQRGAFMELRHISAFPTMAALWTKRVCCGKYLGERKRRIAVKCLFHTASIRVPLGKFYSLLGVGGGLAWFLCWAQGGLCVYGADFTAVPCKSECSVCMGWGCWGAEALAVPKHCRLGLWPGAEECSCTGGHTLSALWLKHDNEQQLCPDSLPACSTSIYQVNPKSKLTYFYYVSGHFEHNSLHLKDKIPVFL